jgi:hypothetical protein
VEQHGYLGGTIVGLAYLAAGARIGLLSLRTRKAPERLLALALTLWGLAFVCWQVPLVLDDETHFEPLYFAGRLLTDSGTVASVFFLRLVFRPRSRVGWCLVAGVCGALALGIAGSAWLGDLAALHPLRNPWWWLEWAAVVVSVAWIGVEGLHHYGMAKLRERIGLCTPAVRHRFLLWGVAGATWTACELAYVFQQIEFDATGLFSASLDAVTATLEFVPIGCIWLIFFPPARYRRWIDRANAQRRAAWG